MREATSAGRGILVFVGLAGLAALRLMDVEEWPAPRPLTLAVAGGVVVGAALLVFGLRASRETLRLGHLLPWVVTSLTFVGIDYLTAWPLMAGWNENLLVLEAANVAINVSLALLVGILLWAVHASWATRMLDDARQGVARSGAARWARVLADVPRTLLLLFVGWGGVFGLVILLGLATGPRGGGAWIVAALAVGVTVWNVLTAALLPVGLAHPGTALQGLRAGLAAGLRVARRTVVPVVVQCALLGIFILLSLDVSDRRGNSTTHNERTILYVHGVSTAGYESDSKWDEQVQDAYDEAPIPWIDFVTTFAMLVVAYAVKLHVLRVIDDGVRAPAAHEMEPDGVTT
ncbi:MAG: hypothetical protein R3F05_15775 [Planctomycetota bacterium]